MKSPRFALAAVAAGAVLVAPSVSAGLNRTAVSINGNDAGNCAVATPCRTIGTAIAQTNPGGEVVVLDSGGYGPFVVDRAITVQAAPGVYAGVTAPAGYAVYVNAGPTDRVVLRGLTINGMGTGNTGVGFTGGGAEVHVESCTITGFVGEAVLSFFPITIQDSVIRDSATGVNVDNAGAAVSATLERVRISNVAGYGVLAWRNAKVTVRDAVAFQNGTAFKATDGGVLVIETGVAAQNGVGASSAPTLGGSAGTIRLSNATIVENTTGFAVGAGGLIESWGNNRIAGNTGNSGALTTVLYK